MANGIFPQSSRSLCPFSLGAGVLRATVCWMRHGCCTHERIAAVVTYARPLQDQTGLQNKARLEKARSLRAQNAVPIHFATSRSQLCGLHISSLIYETSSNLEDQHHPSLAKTFKVWRRPLAQSLRMKHRITALKLPTERCPNPSVAPFCPMFYSFLFF